MSAPAYPLIDEPRPGALSGLAVKPIWPLLAVMLGGAFVSWPWFVLNGYAVGSPTRRQELRWALIGPAGCLTLLLLLGWLGAEQIVGGLALRYLAISVLVFKLYVTYQLFTLQSRSFSLYEYFGGRIRSGLLPLVAAFLLRQPLLAPLPDLLQIVLG